MSDEEIKRFIEKNTNFKEDVECHSIILKLGRLMRDKLSQSSVTDEEIEKKAFDLSYIYRDDDDLKRQDAVQDNCEEMGYWIRNKLNNKISS